MKKQKEKKEILTFPHHYVAIGASAGGLEAIESFFTHIPADTGMGFIVVQHLSPDYKSLMVELLSKKTDMPVHRAEDGMKVEANNVYLIPPKKDLTIFHGKLLLNEQKSRGINLPIDLFFRSLAEDQAEKSIAIVLSGTGSDGTRGVRAIKEHGGMVMVQDEESARFDGMPRAAISTGLADMVLPPEKMPDEILSFINLTDRFNKKGSDYLSDDDGMTKLFAMLRDKTKVDFTYYKPSTITRRIERRMTVNQISDLQEYVNYLQRYPGELTALYRELLIGVTNFFRDIEAFDELHTKWLPELLKNTEKKEIRFWVAGCSTGEEAYTLAILAREVMSNLNINLDVKIFATDIDRDAILVASNGVYPESIAADLKPQLLTKYFYKKADNYAVARNIREMVVFAQHNLVKDPPFTNIDLVSCRNLLIYLQPVLQQKALEMFNFSLNPQGILFLGSSESIGEMSSFFETVNPKLKLYKALGNPNHHFGRPVQRNIRGSFPINSTKLVTSKRIQTTLQEERTIDRFIDAVSGKYLPLAVIVNESMEVVHIIGDAKNYFKLPSGKAVYDISKMVPKELSIPISTGLQKVFRNKEDIRYNNIRFRGINQTDTIDLRLMPLPEKKGSESLVVVFIEEVNRPETETSKENYVYDISDEAEQRIKDLEQELQFTKENLQATIEELETSNEELQATNEELLASNEELQSTNEELQSTNEELHTVNSEYQNQIIELTELHNDVDNLLTSSHIGQLILDENLEIRKFSPEVTRIFKIIEHDIGRPLSHLTNNIVGFNIIEEAEVVLETNRTFESTIRTQDDKYYLARIIPYHVGPDTFSGVLITFVDTTAQNRIAKELEETLKLSNDLIDNMPSGIFIYQVKKPKTLILETANNSALKKAGIKKSDIVGTEFNELWPQAEKMGIKDKFLKAYKTGTPFISDMLFYEDDRISGYFRVVSFKLPNERLAVSFENITSHIEALKHAQEAEELKMKIFDEMLVGVVYQNNKGEILYNNPAAEKILGLTADQLRGSSSLDPKWRSIKEDGTILPGEDHPAMVSLRTGKPVRNFIFEVFNPKTEAYCWILVNSVPIFEKDNNKPSQVYTTFNDITEMRRVKDTNKNLENQLDLVYRNSDISWWEYDLQHQSIVSYYGILELLGYDEAEIKFNTEFWHSRIHPKDAEKIQKSFDNLVSGKTKEYNTEYRLKAKNGKFIKVNETAIITEEEISGKPIKVFGVIKKA